MYIKYDQEIIKEIESKFDLLEYANKILNFNYVSGAYWAHCQRHVDKTASLRLYPESNSYYCFSCHSGGGPIRFMMDYEHLTYNEAVDKICRLTGNDIRNLKTCESLKFFKALKYKSESQVKKQCARNVLTDKDLSNLRPCTYGEPEEWIEEGITPEAIEKFDIRIDDMANRICYLQYDNNDNIIGIKGRTRYERYKEMGIPKYTSYKKIGTINFFQGMHENRQNILNKNEVIIFEGIKSVLKAYSWGYDNCVSAETSCLNKSQIDILIGLGIRNVVIGFDSDVAYRKVVANVEKLKKFVNVYIIYDSDNLLGGADKKASPPDAGKEIFDKLYRSRKRIT